MKEYKVVYERQVKSIYSFWTFATEIIEARGIVHAQTLATAHLRELKKQNNFPMRIGKIREVIEDDD